MINNKTKSKIMMEKLQEYGIQCNVVTSIYLIESMNGDFVKAWNNKNTEHTIDEEKVEEWYKEYEMRRISERLYEVIHHRYSRDQCLECVIKSDGDQALALTYLMEMG